MFFPGYLTSQKLQLYAPATSGSGAHEQLSPPTKAGRLRQKNECVRRGFHFFVTRAVVHFRDFFFVSRREVCYSRFVPKDCSFGAWISMAIHG